MSKKDVEKAEKRTSKEEKWLMREIRFLEEFKEDADEILKLIESLQLERIEPANVLDHISRLKDVEEKIERDFSESNRMLRLISVSERRRIRSEKKLMKRLKKVNEDIGQATKQEILDLLDQIYVYSAQLLTELSTHTGKLNDLIGEEGKYVARFKYFVAKRDTRILSRDFLESFSLKSRLVEEDADKVVTAAKALLSLLEHLKKLLDRLEQIIEAREKTKKVVSKSSSSNIPARLAKIKVEIAELSEQASGIVALNYYGDLVNEKILHFFVNSLNERFSNPNIEYFAKDNEPLNQWFLDNYSTSLKEANVLLEAEKKGKTKLYLNVVRKKLEAQLVRLKQEQIVTASFVRELESHLEVIRCAIEYFVKLRMTQIKDFEDRTLLTHATSNKGLQKMVTDEVMLSAKDSGRVVHTLELDKLLKLDEWNFFAVNWGILTVDDYALIYDAKKFVKLDVDVNFVKYDQGTLGFLFLYLLLEKLFAKGFGFKGGLQAKAEGFMRNFRREKGLRKASYGDFLNEIVAEIPETEIKKFFPRFQREHILPNQETNRRRVLHLIKEYSKDVRTHDIANNKFGLWEERLPEIRASSPFPIFNKALIGFFVPSSKVSSFVKFLRGAEKEVDDLLIYTRPSGGKISKKKVSSL